MKQIFLKQKTKSYFPYQYGLLFYCYFIINVIIICKFREGEEKAFPSQIPISLLTMEITAIRVPRRPLIEINGKRRHREEWQAQAGHSASRGIGWWGLVRGQITFTSEWLADIQPEPLKPPRPLCILCGPGRVEGQCWTLVSYTEGSVYERTDWGPEPSPVLHTSLLELAQHQVWLNLTPNITFGTSPYSLS